MIPQIIGKEVKTKEGECYYIKIDLLRVGMMEISIYTTTVYGEKPFLLYKKSYIDTKNRTVYTDYCIDMRLGIENTIRLYEQEKKEKEDKEKYSKLAKEKFELWSGDLSKDIRAIKDENGKVILFETDCKFGRKGCAHDEGFLTAIYGTYIEDAREITVCKSCEKGCRFQVEGRSYLI